MLAVLLTCIVAAIQSFIVYLQMFAWDKPAGRKAFRTTAEFAEASKVLAANQGLYNGFLAAGVIVGLILGGPDHVLTVFALACVLVAGLYGAATASFKILSIQAAPAAAALVAVLAGI